MKSDFGHKLKSLREKENLSLEGLGQLVDVSKQSIYRYESNAKNPSSSTLLKISNVLNVDPTYFFNSDILDIKLEDINFREEESVPNYNFSIDDVKEKCKDYLMRLLELEVLTNEKNKFSNPLEGLEINSKKDVEKAAKNLRKKWKLGYAPIADVTELIENNNISIIEVELIQEFTGLSGFANEEIPFIVINSNCTDITRKRFTLLHELAHIILEFTDSLNKEYIEKLCNHFAGAILLVDDTLERELGKNRKKITLKELKNIKEKYGISVKSIIMRARVTNLISQNTSDIWWDSYTKWNTSTAPDIEFGKYICKEKPLRFNKLITKGIKEEKISWGKAASLKKTKVDLLKSELNQLDFIVS